MKTVMRWYFICIIVIMLSVMVTNVAVALGNKSSSLSAAFPEPIYLTIKPNQTAVIVPATFCDTFLVERLPDLTLKVTCRVYMKSTR